MAKLYEPSGRVSDCTPRNGKTFTLEELQALVGGYIEMVRIPGDAGKWVLFVDEGGPAQAPAAERRGLAPRGPSDRRQRPPLFTEGG